jgi:hypothetical protein
MAASECCKDSLLVWTLSLLMTIQTYIYAQHVLIHSYSYEECCVLALRRMAFVRIDILEEWRYLQEPHGILHSHHRENLKSYIHSVNLWSIYIFLNIAPIIVQMQ